MSEAELSSSQSLQLCPLEHDSTVVTRSCTNVLHLTLTCAKYPLSLFSDASCGVYRLRFVSSRSMLMAAPDGLYIVPILT